MKDVSCCQLEVEHRSQCDELRPSEVCSSTEQSEISVGFHVFVFQKRFAEIQRLLQIGRDRKMMAAALLSPDAMHKPFNVSELSFNVIGPYCITR